MKITLAQLNFRIGDLEANADKIVNALQSNPASDLLVCSELAITGYYPHDLINRPGFIDAQDRALARVVAATRHGGTALVLGYVARNAGPGKPYFNALGLFAGGRQVAEYHKQLLPTYNVFDEARHFEQGQGTGSYVLNGVKLGFLICEDGWNDEGADYRRNPVEELAAQGADIILSINASPSDRGKARAREARFAQLAAKYGRPLVYVNQVGANDAVVFDGYSFVCDATGEVRARLAGFAEDVQTVEVTPASVAPGRLTPLPESAPAQDYAQIVLGLRDYARKCGIASVVVGSSGGIDSAVTLALAAAALGPENVTAITMPSVYSSSGSVTDSVALCANLGVRLIEHPIAAAVDVLAGGFGVHFDEVPRGLTLENLQARVRGVILMAYSNQFGALVLSTGNKSELAVGYATLYGDMNGGLNLIGDLYKMEVYALASYVNQQAGRALIPVEIIDKAPSAELAPGQRDSDSLPPYPVLDAILKLYIEQDVLAGAERAEQLSILSLAEGVDVARIRALVDKAEFKRRQAPPIIRVHARAFGAGRQLPVAQGYQEVSYV